MNMAYRYPINEPIPHFSTVSLNFKHCFSQKTIEILTDAAEEGYLDTEALFINGTHIKPAPTLRKK